MDLSLLAPQRILQSLPRTPLTKGWCASVRKHHTVAFVASNNGCIRRGRGLLAFRAPGSSFPILCLQVFAAFSDNWCWRSRNKQQHPPSFFGIEGAAHGQTLLPKETPDKVTHAEASAEKLLRPAKDSLLLDPDSTASAELLTVLSSEDFPCSLLSLLSPHSAAEMLLSLLLSFFIQPNNCRQGISCSMSDQCLWLQFPYVLHILLLIMSCMELQHVKKLSCELQGFT